MTGSIAHVGTVVKVSHDCVSVNINDGADKCGGCSIRFMCKTSGDDSDVIDVPVKEASLYKTGELVRLTIADRKQYSATLIALVIPCVVLVTGVAAAWLAGLDEGLCALSGLLASSLYFGLLYLIRKKVGSNFVWNIEKLQNE